MKRRTATLGLLLLAGAARADLYGLSGNVYEDDPLSTPPRIYRVDEATGAASAVLDVVRPDGSLVLTGTVGMAYLGGRLYVSDIFGGDGDLHFGTVDLASGVYTGLGDQAGSVNWVTLAPDPAAGVLYTVDGDLNANLGALRRVNPLDGSSVALGRTFYNGQFRPLETLAFDSARSRLYGWSGNSLFVVDPATAGLTLVGDAAGNPIDNLYDMAYDPSSDSLFLQSVDGELYRVDRNTAQLTFLGSNQGSYVNGLAVVPVPEPASLSALGLGALGFLTRRRRF